MESLLVRAAKKFELNNRRTFETRSVIVGIMFVVLAGVVLCNFDGDR